MDAEPSGRIGVRARTCDCHWGTYAPRCIMSRSRHRAAPRAAIREAHARVATDASPAIVVRRGGQRSGASGPCRETLLGRQAPRAERAAALLHFPLCSLPGNVVCVCVCGEFRRPIDRFWEAVPSSSETLECVGCSRLRVRVRGFLHGSDRKVGHHVGAKKRLGFF